MSRQWAGVVPRYGSQIPITTPIRVNGVDLHAQWVASPRRGQDAATLTPSQKDLAALITAENAAGGPLHEFLAVCVGRRAGKSSAILAAAVERARRIPGLAVSYSAQDGIRTGERHRDLMRVIETAGLTGWKPRKQNGSLEIQFSNGSRIAFTTPKPDNFRSLAFDLVILDESQAHGSDIAGELLAGVTPTLDTSQVGQLIIAGTANADRQSLLYSALQSGVTGQPGWGVYWPCADDTDDVTDPSVWQRVHPGLADGLTTQAKIAQNLATLGEERFSEEYMSRWGSTVSQAPFSETDWQACGSEHAERPTRYTLAFDVAPSGDRACLVASWRDEVGSLRLEVIDERPGTAWLAPVILTLSDRSPGLTVGYDTAGANLGVADALGLARPRPRLKGLTTNEMISAAQSLSQAVGEGTVRHARQPELDRAVAGAVRRQIGDSGWAFGRRKSGEFIGPVIAGAVALRLAERLPRASGLTLVSA